MNLSRTIGNRFLIFFLLFAATFPAIAQTQEKPIIVSAGGDGFSLKSAESDFRLLLRGYVQFDGRFFSTENLAPGTDTLLLRRVRPIVEGTLFKYFDFRIMPDFGEGRFVLQEAYLDAGTSAKFRVRAGKYKSPVGLERLQSALDIIFVERALPTNLVPNRDVGIGLFGDLAGGSLSYAAALLNGVADAVVGDNDTDNKKDVAFRVFVTPFKLPNLGIGLAASFGNQDGTPALTGLPAYRSIGQQTFFSYLSDGTGPGTVVADGARIRFSPQGYLYHGPFGLMTEYVYSAQDVHRDSAKDGIRNTSWQLTASYFLTGEKAAYRRVKTLKPFDPDKGTWGAFQVKARYSTLNIDEDAYPLFADITKSASEARSTGFGLNWILNNNVKAFVDFNRTWFEGGSIDGDRADENLINFRLQLAY